jgi:hypothetical protein
MLHSNMKRAGSKPKIPWFRCIEMAEVMVNVEQFSAAQASAWQHLVTLCLATPIDRTEQLAVALAARTGGMKATYKQKLRAIWDARNAEMTREQIIEMGPTAVLSRFAKARRNGRFEKQRVISFRLSKSLADALYSDEPIGPDHEEPDLNRIARLLGFETWEQVWDFLHAEISGWSDEFILHEGGMFTEKDAPKKPKANRAKV